MVARVAIADALFDEKERPEVTLTPSTHRGRERFDTRTSDCLCRRRARHRLSARLSRASVGSTIAHQKENEASQPSPDHFSVVRKALIV
jgi:hypothetical protein